jgi:hypothetical protein
MAFLAAEGGEFDGPAPLTHYLRLRRLAVRLPPGRSEAPNVSLIIGGLTTYQVRIHPVEPFALFDYHSEYSMSCQSVSVVLALALR